MLLYEVLLMIYTEQNFTRASDKWLMLQTAVVNFPGLFFPKLPFCKVAIFCCQYILVKNFNYSQIFIEVLTQLQDFNKTKHKKLK